MIGTSLIPYILAQQSWRVLVLPSRVVSSYGTYCSTKIGYYIMDALSAIAAIRAIRYRAAASLNEHMGALKQHP